MTIPDRIYLYRIVHINNLEYILKLSKLTCSNHKQTDKDFIGIGDSTLIQSRDEKQIPIEPHGSFNDYVSFYFGKRSPMLYNIQHGYNNVTKRKPEEIIYLVTSFNEIKKQKVFFVFTDGHGYHHLSQFFNTEEELNNVDWNTINLNQWNDTEEDPDRKRRKQAEFLVYHELSISAIIAIVVYNQHAKDTVEKILKSHNIKINIFVKQNWYY